MCVIQSWIWPKGVHSVHNSGRMRKKFLRRIGLNGLSLFETYNLRAHPTPVLPIAHDCAAALQGASEVV